MSTLIYKLGDAVYPNANGVKIIPHVCNDIGAFGAGFVVPLQNRWPSVAEIYKREFQNGKPGLSLGTNQYIQVEPYIYVVNMIAQKGIRSLENPKPIDYDALKQCMEKIYIKFAEKGATITCPKFGSFRAGGNWEIIEKMIKDIWVDRGMNVIVYYTLNN